MYNGVLWVGEGVGGFASGWHIVSTEELWEGAQVCERETCDLPC